MTYSMWQLLHYTPLLCDHRVYLGQLQHVAITNVSRIAGASHARILLQPAEDQGAIRYVQWMHVLVFHLMYMHVC